MRDKCNRSSSRLVEEEEEVVETRERERWTRSMSIKEGALMASRSTRSNRDLRERENIVVCDCTVQRMNERWRAHVSRSHHRDCITLIVWLNERMNESNGERKGRMKQREIQARAQATNQDRRRDAPSFTHCLARPLLAAASRDCSFLLGLLALLFVCLCGLSRSCLMNQIWMRRFLRLLARADWKRFGLF